MNVTCGKDFISILVDEEFFKYYNVGVEAVHLINASCRAHREEISGSAYYTAHTPMDQYTACGGKPLEKNITHIVYSLTLMSDPPVYGNIVRDPVVQIEYKCIYPYIRRVSLAFPIISFSRCANDKTTSFGNGTPHPEGRNGEGSTVRYSFDMFRFIHEPHSFYLHCTVHLCTPEDGWSCIPECKTISKREVVVEEQAQGLLSYGPIRRELPVRPKINLLTLALPLGVIWTLGIFFLILISIAKAGIRRHMTNT